MTFKNVSLSQTISVLLISAGLLWPCVAQSPPSSPNTSPNGSDNQLEGRISIAADQYAEWKTDLLKDPERLQKLKEEAQSPDKHLGGQGELAQETLARVGDTNQMDKIVCEVYAKNADVQLNALLKLERIGGYASIKVLSKVMYDDLAYNSSPSGQSVSLRQYAAKALAKLAPTLSVAAASGYCGFGNVLNEPYENQQTTMQ